MESPAYLVLGATHSGRRVAVFDLIKDLASESDPFEVAISKREPPSEYDERIPALEGVALNYFETDLGSLPPRGLRAGFTSILIAAGAMNPVDQVESLKDLLGQAKKELSRILSVVSCRMLSRHPSLSAYYDACIHFSDVVLINEYESVGEKFVKDFIQCYKDDYYPCLFEPLKRGRVKNPSLILETQARRISLYFDPEEDLSEEEDHESIPVDPYLERLPGGIRRKTVPDIAKILDEGASDCLGGGISAPGRAN